MSNIENVGEELLAIIPDGSDLASDYDSRRIGLIIDTFLRSINKADRQIFVRRYWYGDSIADVCRFTGFGESRVKTSLHRTREKLSEVLKKEGVTL